MILATKRFRREYKRICASPQNRDIDDRLKEVLALLTEDRPLPPQYKDHSLIGEWKDCRDCHLKPNIILIYRKPDPEKLELLRLGSHSDLGL
jgi:mRNA interferase YafQ